MADREGGAVQCPACGASIDRARQSRCPQCGIDAVGPLLDEILETDATLYGFKATYDDLVGRWTALSYARAELLRRLVLTRGAPDAAPTPEASPPAATPARASAEAFASPTATATPMPPVRPIDAPRADPATLPPPKPGTGASARPARPPKPARTGPRRLTAPALLGVSGASLLIASAIVFIAVTWQTFFPLAQGLIVAAVAGGTAYLALWLTKHDLATSGGAVGVVAMAFVGVAVVAFNRVAGALGDFAVPVALVGVAAAGLALSRAGILWVGAAAALALGTAATGLTWAFARLPRADGRLVWALAGAVLAAAILASFRLWKTAPSRLVLRVVGVALLSYSSLPLLLDVAWNDRSGWAAVAAAVPLAALVGYAIPWPRFTLAPATALATVVVASVAWGQGATQAQTVSAVAGVTVLVAAACALAPQRWRNPVLLGLAPAGGAIGVSALVVAVQLLFLLGRAGRVAEWFPFSPYSGVAVVIGGVALAAPGLWSPRPSWLRPLSVVGAAFIAVGVTEAAYSIAISVAPFEEWAVAVAFTVGALVVVASALLWRSVPARWVAGVAATVLATIAGLDGAYSLAVLETAIGVCLAVALVPPLLLAAFGTRWPRVTLGSTALLVTALGAAGGYLVHDAVFVAIATGSLVAAVGLWTGSRIPRAWRAPVVIGLMPAVALAVGIGLLNALPVTASFLSGGAYETVWVPDLWTSAITAIGGVALGALRLWSVPRRLVSAVSMAGAVIMVAAGASATLTTASAWGLDAHVGLATIGTVASVVVAGAVVLWSTTAAKLVNGIGATVLLTLAGIHGAVAFASPSASVWLGVAVIASPIVVLAVFGRWWPRITLGPAALLVSIAAVSVARHAEMTAAPSYALVAASVAVVALACAVAPARWRVPLLFGSVPAAAATAVIAVGIGATSIASVIERGTSVEASGAAVWTTTGAALLAVAAAASRWWRVGKPAETGTQIAGALSAAVAAANAATIVAHPWEDNPVLVSAATVVFALVGAAAILLWSRVEARRVGAVASIAWLTFVALVNNGRLADTYAFEASADSWWGRLAIAVAVVAILAAAGARWPTYTLGPAAFLATSSAFSAVDGRGGAWTAALFAAAVGAAVVAWIANATNARARAALRWGLAPVGAVLAVYLLWAAGTTLGALLWSFSRIDPPWNLDPCDSAVVAAVLAGACSLRWVRDRIGWIAVAAIPLIASGLPGHWAWIATAIVAVAAFVAWVARGASTRVSGDAVLVLSFFAFGLGARWNGAFAGMSVLCAVTALGLAIRGTGRLAQRGLLVAPVYGAFAAGFAVVALDGSAGLALAFAMVVALGISIGAAAGGLDPDFVVTPVAVALATAVIPLASPAATRSGVALLLAGAGWLALAVLRWRPARWISSGVLSLGTALVLVGAHVTVVEAYTAVPAISILAIGLWWLVGDPSVTTMRALGPGLAVALAPSLVTLMTDPTHLVRTLALTGATVVLAVVGVGLRWFAPILATSITAVTVSFTQVFASEQIVPRWVSFAVVGSLLLAIAATYEKLKTLR